MACRYATPCSRSVVVVVVVFKRQAAKGKSGCHVIISLESRYSILVIEKCTTVEYIFCIHTYLCFAKCAIVLYSRFQEFG